MDPRLKRLAFILPVLVIFGVYTNLIPLGTDFKALFSSEEVKPKEKIFPMIEKIRGEVMMKELPSYPPVSLKGGERLKEGATITTGENSAALLTYRGQYHWEAHLASKTQINVDELMNQRPEETTLFNLVTGAIGLKVKNSSGIVRRISVRTKFASFGVQGTKFAVLTDGEKRSLMIVNEGTVIAENYKTSAKTKVIDGHTYLINREGESNIVLNLDALNLFNWDIQNLNQEIPSLEEVISRIGDVGPALDDQENAQLSQLKEVDEKITEFKSKDRDLLRELETLQENALQSRDGLRAETVKVEKDIRCLQTSPSECSLYSEKILVGRGLPRMWGNPRYRASMVVELQKYLIERNEEVAGREDEARILAKLMSARKTAINQIEVDRKEGNNIDEIIQKLEDNRLKR
jgi:hypothetical protein